MRKKLFMSFISVFLMAIALAGCGLFKKEYELNIIEDEGVSGYSLATSAEKFKSGTYLILDVYVKEGYLLDDVLYDGEEISCEKVTNLLYACDFETKGKDATLDIKSKEARVVEPEFEFEFNSDHGEMLASDNTTYYAGYEYVFKFEPEVYAEVTSVKAGSLPLEYELENSVVKFVLPLVEDLDTNETIIVDIETSIKQDYARVQYMDLDATTVKKVVFMQKSSITNLMYEYNATLYNSNIDNPKYIAGFLADSLDIGSAISYTIEDNVTIYPVLEDKVTVTFEDAINVDEIYCIPNVSCDFGKEDLEYSELPEDKYFKGTYLIEGGEADFDYFDLMVKEWKDITISRNLANKTKVTFEDATNVDYIYCIPGVACELEKDLEYPQVPEDKYFKGYIVSGGAVELRLELDYIRVEEGEEITISRDFGNKTKVTFEDATNVDYIYCIPGVACELEEDLEYPQLPEDKYFKGYIVSGGEATLHLEGNYIIVEEGKNITISRELGNKTKVMLFSGDSNATAIKEYVYITPGDVLYPKSYFEVDEENYYISEVLVNGAVNNNYYVVGSTPITVRVTTKKYIKVTVEHVSNAQVVNKTIKVQQNEAVNISYLYTLDEGYEINKCIVNGSQSTCVFTPTQDTFVVISLRSMYRVNYVAVDGATPKVQYEYYGMTSIPHITINALDKFDIDTEVYTLKYCVVDETTNVEDCSIDLKDYMYDSHKILNISLSLEKKLLISFESHVSEWFVANFRDSYYFSRSATLNLANFFTVQEGYFIDYYLVNGDEKDENLIVDLSQFEGVEEVVFTLEVSKGIRVSYLSANHATSEVEYEYIRADSKLILDNYTFDEGYELDYYTVDGLRVDEAFYVVGSDIIVSVVAKPIAQ